MLVLSALWRQGRKIVSLRTAWATQCNPISTQTNKEYYASSESHIIRILKDIEKYARSK
jgi:hypothetical protein